MVAGAVAQVAFQSRTARRKMIFSAVKSFVAANWRRGVGLIVKAFSSAPTVYISLLVCPERFLDGKDFLSPAELPLVLIEREPSVV